MAKKELYGNASYYAVVQKGQTFVGLAANVSSVCSYNIPTALGNGKLGEAWLDKHNAQKTSYNAIRREAARRETIELAAKVEQMEKEHKADDRRRATIKRVYKEEAMVEFPEILPAPNRDDYYKYKDGEQVWSSFKNDEYNEARTLHQESERIYRKAYIDFFDDFPNDKMVTAMFANGNVQAFLGQGFLFQAPESKASSFWLIPNSLEYDEKDDIVRVRCIMLDDDFKVWGEIVLPANTTLIATKRTLASYYLIRIDGSNRFDQDQSSYRLTFAPTEGETFAQEVDVQLDWKSETDYKLRVSTYTPKAGINISGSTRSTKEAQALVSILEATTKIAVNWDGREEIVVDRNA